VRVAAFCSWQPDRRRRPTIVVIHGLEGSADAGYVLGTADKGFQQGLMSFAITCELRGTEHLTPTLYHSGLTIDLHLC
jgi:predicted alpha/beta-fold hydrolase